MTVQTSTAAAAITRGGLALAGDEQVRLVASLFYFRIPRELWASRLRQVRESGYQLIDVYLPWNFHELAPGEWDFTGRRDVGAFLDLAHAEGLGIVARPGPYICSEWDGGGLPAWLSLEPGLRLRQAEPRYLKAVRAWFDRALPLLAERQYGAGGGVVAVQVENELDFFDASDRPAYLAALRDMATARGITVPLVACAGQGDLAGATGEVEGVVPAFNFYPDDRSVAVEAEVRRYAELAGDRGLPLLVTETNRSHTTLRRLVVSGAKLVAPYLQASGYNFGYTPSVGNWGDPGGFMSHDYDFGGYLSPVGEPRAEMAEARVLAAVLRTLGPALARAVPDDAVGAAYRTTAPTSMAPSRLRLAGGGTLLGMVNLGEEWSQATLPARGALPDIDVELPPSSCLLVVQDLPLDGLGLPATLTLSTADIVGRGTGTLELSARARSVVALERDGEVAILHLDAPQPGSPVQADAVLGASTVRVNVRHPQDVDAPAAGSAAVEPRVHDVGLLRSLALCGTEGTWTRCSTPPASEALGVYRGRAHFGASLHDAGLLLLEGAADIVDIALDGRALPTVASMGGTFLVPTDGADLFEATVETWGHPNFDDARLPGLVMGSRRGLGHVWSVVDRIDVSALWEVTGAGQWAGLPAPLRSLGGWSSTRLGADVTYRRALPVDDVSHHALHLSGVPGSVLVEVDGHGRTVSAHDPWLHLAPGEGAHVQVTLPHVPGSLGTAELLRLEEVRGWDVLAQPDHVLAELATRPADGVVVGLPLVGRPGVETWFDCELPPGGWSIRCEGRQARVSVFSGGELLGRVWLEDAARPQFTGGDPGRVWLPAAWNTGSVRLAVHFTAGDHGPLLAAVRAVATEE